MSKLVILQHSLNELVRVAACDDDGTSLAEKLAQGQYYSLTSVACFPTLGASLDDVLDALADKHVVNDWFAMPAWEAAACVSQLLNTNRAAKSPGWAKKAEIDNGTYAALGRSVAEIVQCRLEEEDVVHESHVNGNENQDLDEQEVADAASVSVAAQECEDMADAASVSLAAEKGEEIADAAVVSVAAEKREEIADAASVCVAAESGDETEDAASVSMVARERNKIADAASVSVAAERREQIAVAANVCVDAKAEETGAADAASVSVAAEESTGFAAATNVIADARNFAAVEKQTCENAVLVESRQDEAKPATLAHLLLQPYVTNPHLAGDRKPRCLRCGVSFLNDACLDCDALGKDDSTVAQKCQKNDCEGSMRDFEQRKACETERHNDAHSFIKEGPQAWRRATTACREQHCETCKGRGSMQVVCRHCDGWGNTPDAKRGCETCHGEGLAMIECVHCNGKNLREDKDCEDEDCEDVDCEESFASNEEELDEELSDISNLSSICGDESPPHRQIKELAAARRAAKGHQTAEPDDPLACDEPTEKQTPRACIVELVKCAKEEAETAAHIRRALEERLGRKAAAALLEPYEKRVLRGRDGTNQRYLVDTTGTTLRLATQQENVAA